jgi:hypothetical protein
MFVIPAKAGIHLQEKAWIPAFAGMTEEKMGMTEEEAGKAKAPGTGLSLFELSRDVVFQKEMPTPKEALWAL